MLAFKCLIKMDEFHLWISESKNLAALLCTVLLLLLYKVCPHMLCMLRWVVIVVMHVFECLWVCD